MNVGRNSRNSTFPASGDTPRHLRRTARIAFFFSATSTSA
jgi:hypothetical protein